MKRRFVFLFLFITSLIRAQDGKISGTVLDDATGETLVGVTIIIQGTTTGTITDLDGKFTLSVPGGDYPLQISYISYAKRVIEAVHVSPGEINLLGDIRLGESTVELEEVVIKAKAVRTTEAALQTVKRKSTVMLDGISAGRISLIGDATAVEAAKRITGVSIEGGKYIYVRGLGDRYSKITLNGMAIPGLDPDRNTLQMDIFPTSLINNMMVSKNFMADMPADFTGGIMNVETKDFPERKIFSVKVGTSFNPDMHFNSNSLDYGGSGTDFLGFDNGTRALPERAGTGQVPLPIFNPDQEVNEFVNSFNKELGAVPKTNFMDYDASISFGNQIDLKENDASGTKNPKLGYIFSLSYRADNRYYDEVADGLYERRPDDPGIYELRYANLQAGSHAEKSVLIGALGGIACKTNFSKLRFTVMRLQNGESRSAQFYIDNNPEATGQSGYYAISHNLEYSQRSLTNVFLGGTHDLPDKGWEIDWRISPTRSTSDDPDIRKTAYTLTSGGGWVFSPGAGGNPSRIWRTLREWNVPARLDFTRKYRFNGAGAKLKFGAGHIYRIRQYEIVSFSMQFSSGNQQAMPWKDPDPGIVLDEGNIYPDGRTIYYNSDVQYGRPNPNEYSSNVNTTSVYVSNGFQLGSRLKSTLGVRAENYIQRHTGRDQTYAGGDVNNGRNLDNDKVLGSLDLFPSVNFIYSVSELQNLRFSYTRTIARPSFKELSFAQIIDPLSNRIFNGGLFPIPPDWNGGLVETHIDNIDLRWEIFLTGGQTFSASAFYKHFKDPIELVRITAQQTSSEYQPRNVGTGSLYGMELEMRKDLDFISDFFSDFNISGNFTCVRSRLDMTDSEYKDRKAYERTGETVERTRVMAGQAPYVVNAGLMYGNHDIGLDAGLFYNVKGPTLTIVGSGLIPDVYALPFHSLNLSLNKRFGKEQKFSVEFKVSNIIGDRIDEVYRSFQAEDQPYFRLYPATAFGLGLKYSL